jgi:hypothetical protein
VSDASVCYHDEAGRLHKLPVGWTSLRSVDVFEVYSAGRALFRPAELLEVAALVEQAAAVLPGRDEGGDV